MAKQTISRYAGIKHVTDIRLANLVVNIETDVFGYPAKEGEMLTDLAWKFLGNAQYYWVLADINNINNPFTMLEPGQVIYIVKRDVFSGMINAQIPIK